jgi:hypothetical protein
MSAMQMQYLSGARFEKWLDTVIYSAGDVTMLSTTNRWYRAISSNVGDTPPGAAWLTYPGEKQIGANYYAFNRIVSCMSGQEGDTDEMYAWTQYRLRETDCINDNPIGEEYIPMSGSLANPICYYVGNVLYGYPGVWFANFDPNVTNALTLQPFSAAEPDAGGIDSEFLPTDSGVHTFPFVAAGTMQFNTDLVNDLNAKYWMYFSSAGSAVYDTASAGLVNNNSGNPISGDISQASITFDFDYTNNNQHGRTADTNAPIQVVAMGLSGAEWIVAPFTITKATGLTFPVNAATERNYVG